MEEGLTIDFLKSMGLLSSSIKRDRVRRVAFVTLAGHGRRDDKTMDASADSNYE